MRLHSGLPKEFWEETVNTTTYLVNHEPTIALDFCVSDEAWIEKYISLSHLMYLVAHAI